MVTRLHSKSLSSAICKPRTFRKDRGVRGQIANIHWIRERAREFQKNIYFCFIDYTEIFDHGITTNHGKFKRWECQTTVPVSWETCMLIKKQQLNLGSKLEKENAKAIYCNPAYLTYMQSKSCETSGWMKHKLESRVQGEISITSDMQVTPPRKRRGTEEPLYERGEWKIWLKTQHSKH